MNIFFCIPLENKEATKRRSWISAINKKKNGYDMMVDVCAVSILSLGNLQWGPSMIFKVQFKLNITK